MSNILNYLNHLILKKKLLDKKSYLNLLRILNITLKEKNIISVILKIK